MELIEETRKICVQERTKSILFWISNVLLTYGIGALTLFEQVLAKRVLAHDTDGALKVYSDLLDI